MKLIHVLLILCVISFTLAKRNNKDNSIEKMSYEEIEKEIATLKS